MNDEGIHSTEEEQDGLNRQLERGGLFTHTALTRLAARVNESESFLYAIVDLMIRKGLITPEEITETVQQVRQELIEKQEAIHPGLALRVDAEGYDEYTPVNCEERWHVCQAICCKLDFALNAEEVESGNIKWDMGRPYYVRHERNCFCTHMDIVTRQCGIYHNRPAVCKKYSCAEDSRIWKDFNAMELNHDFINTNLRETRPKLVGSPMFTDQTIVYKKKP
jgi:Fe-S-cluster containining protein